VKFFPIADNRDAQLVAADFYTDEGCAWADALRGPWLVGGAVIALVQMEGDFGQYGARGGLGGSGDCDRRAF
jgi:hypothetical protein